MKNARKNRKNLTLILGWLLLTGCVGPSTNIKETAVATLTPLPIATFTAEPPKNTPDNGLSATLSPQQASAAILQLYNDDSCKLPCLWGIIPGKTSAEEFYRRFRPFASFRDTTSQVGIMNYSAFEVIPPKEIDFDHEDQWFFAFTFSNDILRSLTTRAQHLKPFSKPSLAKILTAFGEPDEIWIMVSQHQMRAYTFHLDLFYPKVGILVNGKGDAKLIAEMKNGVDVSICPQAIQTVPDTQEDVNEPITFHVWDPGEKISYPELTMPHFTDEQKYLALDSLITEMDEARFYDTYLDPATTECFDLSMR